MKISRKVYFLILIVEECAEIIHRTCKAIRFGMDERWKPETKTNKELLREEILDLQAVLMLNVEENTLDPFEVREIEAHREEKRKRVFNFLAYSYDGCETVFIHQADFYNPPMCYHNWIMERGDR